MNGPTKASVFEYLVNKVDYVIHLFIKSFHTHVNYGNKWILMQTIGQRIWLTSHAKSLDESKLFVELIVNARA